MSGFVIRSALISEQKELEALQLRASLTNADVKKHSGASKAQVSMQVVGVAIRLLVSDHGVGFNPQGIKGHEVLGTRSMAERAHLLGGHLDIRSKVGKGTIITVRIPLQPKSSSIT